MSVPSGTCQSYHQNDSRRWSISRHTTSSGFCWLAVTNKSCMQPITFRRWISKWWSWNCWWTPRLGGWIKMTRSSIMEINPFSHRRLPILLSFVFVTSLDFGFKGLVDLDLSSRPWSQQLKNGFHLVTPNPNASWIWCLLSRWTSILSAQQIEALQITIFQFRIVKKKNKKIGVHRKMERFMFLLECFLRYCPFLG